MQMIEKMAWNKDGARHAQVDCHCAVPRVTPAAISAPTLSSDEHMSVRVGSLVEIIQDTDTPRSPASGECL